MKAIFNREFRAYFTSMLGYVFLTIFLLLTGVMFYAVNIGYMTARMTSFFSIINSWAIFLLPLLTMRLFSEDRKLKTDQLLLTAPVSTAEIVFGKYFAALGALMVGIVITNVYPIILSILGNLPVAETVSCYIGFVLLCAVILSVGAFMSSLTESQIVAAIATYGALILMTLLGTMASKVPSEAVVKIMLWLSPMQRFSDFTLGILNIEAIVYYLSITGLFLFFTIMVFERRKKTKTNSAPIIAAAVIIVVLANVFVTMLTDKFPIKIDLTTNKMYELSDRTKEYLKNYDTPVDIYILAGESEQDENIRAVLDKYATSCKSIRLTNINMSSNPTFGKKYVTGTASLQANSVIVDGGDRFKMYTMNDLYGVNAQTGMYTSLNVENRITSALKYVSSDTALGAYIVKGHNEMEIDGAKSVIEAENYTVKEINTLTDNIPSDASLLIIAKPTADFSKEEISKLDAYLLNGGQMQVYFDVESQNLQNLYGYLSGVWGIEVNDNVVIETDISKSVSLAGTSMSLVVPVVKQSEFTESIIKNQRTLAYFPYSKSLTQKWETNGNLSVTPILTSSEKSYTTTNYENVTKTGKEQEGEFIVGALAADTKHNSSVYVSGNTMLLSIDRSTLTDNYGLANYDYLINLINYTLGNDDNFTVNEKTLVDNVITVSAMGERIVFALVVILIPVVLLAIGVIIWIKRRHL